MTIIMMDGEPALDLARELDRDIESINKKGIRINIEKYAVKDFDSELANKLARKGVTRLPALLDGSRAVVGVDNILSTLRTGHKKFDEKFTPLGNNDTDISAFWHSELFKKGDDKKTYVPRDDVDDNGDDDFKVTQRKLSEYERKKPKHRRQGESRRRTPADNIDDRGRTRNDDRNDDRDDDGDDRDEYGGRASDRQYSVEPSDDDTGDAMDASMLTAWLNNNTAASD